MFGRKALESSAHRDGKGAETLVGLALANVRRNWHRSLLGIAGMCTAAAVMTAALSLPQGFPAQTDAVYRRFIGGDVVIYADRLALDRAAPTDPAGWRWRPFLGPWDSDLDFFFPDVRLQGTLVRPGASASAYLDLEALQEILAGRPDVVAVYPYLTLPAFYRAPDGSLHPAPLRGRDPALDGGAVAFDAQVVEGRPLQAADADRSVALVHGPRPFYRPLRGYRPSFTPPDLERTIDVLVPAIRGFDRGRPVYDFSDLRAYRLQVVGRFELPVVFGTARTEAGVPIVLDNGQTLTAWHYWETPQVLVPRGFFERVYREVGGGEPRFVRQAAVVARDTLRARALAEDLRRLLPERTVLTVPEQVALSAARRGLVGLPADVSRSLGLVTVILAALLLVANVYVLVAQRRREIAVLRAIGASALEVAQLVLAETLGFALLGGILGVVFIRGLVSLGLLVHGLGLAEMMADHLRVGGAVLGVVTAAGLALGLFPAWEAARTSPAEILRRA